MVQRNWTKICEKGEKIAKNFPQNMLSKTFVKKLPNLTKNLEKKFCLNFFCQKILHTNFAKKLPRISNIYQTIWEKFAKKLPNLPRISNICQTIWEKFAKKLIKKNKNLKPFRFAKLAQIFRL